MDELAAGTAEITATRSSVQYSKIMNLWRLSGSRSAAAAARIMLLQQSRRRRRRSILFGNNSIVMSLNGMYLTCLLLWLSSTFFQLRPWSCSAQNTAAGIKKSHLQEFFWRNVSGQSPACFLGMLYKELRTLQWSWRIATICKVKKLDNEECHVCCASDTCIVGL